MKAEKEAHEIVAKARQYRQQRLKQAKIDASTEINEYKIEKERDLEEYEASSAGGIESLERDEELRVRAQLEEIKTQACKKENEVVEFLVEAVIKTDIIA